MGQNLLQNQPNNNYTVVKAPSPPAFTPEWALFRFLETFTPEDIEIAIRTNYKVDLSSALGSIVDAAVEEVLEKFKSRRPDLYAILASKKGKEWLKRQIKTSLTQK